MAAECFFPLLVTDPFLRLQYLALEVVIYSRTYFMGRRILSRRTPVVHPACRKVSSMHLASVG